MLLKRNKDHGIFLAIWPRRTPEGWVSCEWLHWERVQSWGWGSCDTFRYARFVPNELYDAGVRRKFWGGKAYETPLKQTGDDNRTWHEVWNEKHRAHELVKDADLDRGAVKAGAALFAPYSDHRDPLKWPDPAPGG